MVIKAVFGKIKPGNTSVLTKMECCQGRHVNLEAVKWA